MLRKTLCAAFLCVIAGSAFAAETDWDKLSRKAEEAARAAVRDQNSGVQGIQTTRDNYYAPDSADSAALLRSYQLVMNQAAADGRSDIMDWLRQKAAALVLQSPNSYAPDTNSNANTLDWLYPEGANIDTRSIGNNQYNQYNQYNQNSQDEVLQWLRQQGVDVNTNTRANNSNANQTGGVADWLRNSGFGE